MREDWVRVTPAIAVEWEEEKAYLQAIYLNPRVTSAWEWEAMITVGSRGQFRIVELDDIRVPPGWTGPYR